MQNSPVDNELAKDMDKQRREMLLIANSEIERLRNVRDDWTNSTAIRLAATQRLKPWLDKKAELEALLNPQQSKEQRLDQIAYLMAEIAHEVYRLGQQPGAADSPYVKHKLAELADESEQLGKEKEELLRQALTQQSNVMTEPKEGEVGPHLTQLIDQTKQYGSAQSVERKTMPPVVKKADFSDVQKAVNVVIKNNPEMDKVVKAAMERLAPQLAKEVSKSQERSVNEAKQQLLKDAQQSFGSGMEQVAGIFGELEGEVFRKVEEIKSQMVQTVIIRSEPSGVAALNLDRVREMEGLFHKDFPVLLTILGEGNPVVLTGPTQSAKSKHTELAAVALGLEYYYHAFGPTQTETALAGFITATGEFNYRSLYLAAKYGGVWVGDEADVVRDAGVLIWMNNLISNRIASFPMGKKSEGLRAFEASIGWEEPDPLKQDMAGGTFDVHKDFKVILTMNTYGEGGSGTYKGRGFIDKSTLARFDFLYWGYDESLERAIVERAVPHTTTNRWIYWSQAVRAAVEEEKVGEQIVVSPNNTMRGAKLLAAGMTWEQATEISLLPRKSNDPVYDRVLSGARRIYEEKTGERAKA